MSVKKSEELEEAYGQLESLNREMRAQRHDFMNHLQVVYSLIEMNESGEAMEYMDRVYGDIGAYGAQRCRSVRYRKAVQAAACRPAVPGSGCPPCLPSP